MNNYLHITPHGRVEAMPQGLRAALDMHLARARAINSVNPVGELTRRMDSAGIGALASRFGVRQDSAEAQLRQLEHIRAKALEEPIPPTNAMKLWRTVRDTPVGANSVTVRRFVEQGEAQFYRGGDVSASVGIRQHEETWKVQHIVTSLRFTLFEQQASDFARLTRYARLVRGARRAIEQFHNDKLFNGSTASRFLGLANYPYLARKVSATNFYADGSTAADDVLAELNAAANYPAQQSKQAMSPNRCVTSLRVRDYLMNTRIGSVNDTTIGEFFGRTNAYIDTIDAAHELRDIGGTGMDGVLFYNDDPDTIAIDVPQDFTPLPLQTFGFDSTQYFYMSTAGLQAYNVGNCLMLLVPAAA